ncbi:AP-3 complex subunit beta [Coemansia guatemalensis]|uniref:AP-3 complex subunit beta n=1 Tax=Coemansia guatemalensis TaxID=2761395 RepID=A0A9W8I0E9_9FUNG|nr:AP-3 complex subunit beta [Coemansia guatemalensis]
MAEYLSKAMAFAQDAAKLSKRFGEGLVDNALEFGLDTPGSFYDNAEFKLGQVGRELAAGTDKERVVAMKRLVATVAKGQDASGHFAAVVKNVASGSMELRRLVYMYLQRYAEQEPDLALLAVNTFQRDLADESAMIRALALRVLSSIRVAVIGPIVVVAVRRLATDKSAHVRKTAALAVPKLQRLDAALRDELQDTVAAMLDEGSAVAVGAVVRAFHAVSPRRVELVHGHFRRWCAQLGDLDEWGQVEVAKLLVSYARSQFAGPGVDHDTLDPDHQPTSGPLDPDHALALDALQGLLRSRNSAVVLTAVAGLTQLAPAARLTAVAQPLVRLVRGSRETAYAALGCALQVARRWPAALRGHARSFFVAAADAPFTRRLKLQVLAALAPAEQRGTLVREVAAYTQSAQSDVSAGAVRVLLASARGDTMLDAFRSLLVLAADARAGVAGAAMAAVRQLLLDGTVRDAQTRAMTLYDILCHVARLLDGRAGDAARAHIFALVREFAESRFGCQHALDVLRRGARGFADEGILAKQQIVELSVRLRHGAVGDGILATALQPHAHTLAALHAHVFTLARYDVSFDVRDRARALRALVPLPDDAALPPHVATAAHELLGSAAAVAALAATARPPPEFALGSLALALGRALPGYEPLPDWPATPPAAVDRGPLPSAVTAAPRPAQAISIAGISGRAVPAADYGTPRSAADDDLDAFLDSPDEDARRVLHIPPSLPPAAVVFEQSPPSSVAAGLSSDDSDVSRPQSPPSSAAASSSDDSSEDSSDDEARPFMRSPLDNSNSPPPAAVEGTSQYWQ